MQRNNLSKKNYLICKNCIRSCDPSDSFCNRGKYNSSLENCYVQNIDWLFDKPIVYFSGNVKILSIGSWGCNFRCLGCQNAKLSWAESGENFDNSKYSQQDIIEIAINNDCKGICYTFNEPAVILDEVCEIAKEAKSVGLQNFFVTNSTLTPYSVKRISPYLDAVATDIKNMDDDFYHQYCGAEGITNVAGRILKCIKSFYDSGCHVEVRTNLIPGANDDDDNLSRTAEWIYNNLSPDTPWHLTRFFPAHQLNHLSKTLTKTLLKAQKIGMEVGLTRVNAFYSKSCDCAKDSYLTDDNTNSTHKCCCNLN